MTVGLKYPKPVARPKERKPLRRRKYMIKRPPRRLSRAGSDPAYLAWVRTRTCQLFYPYDDGFLDRLQCDGRIHAHHAIHRSQGGKDDVAIPLCDRHHRQWHDANGVFAGLSKFERFAWATRAIAETQSAWAKRGRDGT